MQLTLSPEVEALVNEQMKRGRFKTPNDLLETALGILADTTPDNLAAFNEMLEEGIRSADTEPLYSEQEARAYLAAVRTQLPGLEP